MLRCIQRLETDPYYNLAAEEYLLKHAANDTFMIWRNEPSVIIGKHQNTAKEINHSFVESQRLPVVRRITGGGTVYHDPGCVNFSFIYTGRKENLVDFRHFTQPIILFLRELGLNAEFEGKNNITVDGLKVSGNSAHIYKNKVLHHGTLLFNTHLEALKQAVGGHHENYKDKSVRSVPANVGNISLLAKEKLSVTDFIGLFTSFIFIYFPGCYYDKLTTLERESILKLVEEKYKTIEWNYGYSPDYKYNAEWEMLNGKFSVSMVVSKGQIQQVEIAGPKNFKSFLKSTTDQLFGVFHQKKSVSERLEKITFADKVERELLNQIIKHIF
jgi:lipoate---protein ligase